MKLALFITRLIVHGIIIAGVTLETGKWTALTAFIFFMYLEFYFAAQ